MYVLSIHAIPTHTHTQNDPEVAYVTCGQGMGFGGYQTALCFSRQRGVGVAVLCNAGSDSYELSQARFLVEIDASIRFFLMHTTISFCHAGGGRGISRGHYTRPRRRNREPQPHRRRPAADTAITSTSSTSSRRRRQRRGGIPAIAAVAAPEPGARAGPRQGVWDECGGVRGRGAVAGHCGGLSAAVGPGGWVYTVCVSVNGPGLVWVSWILLDLELAPRDPNQPISTNPYHATYNSCRRAYCGRWAGKCRSI